MQQQRKQQQQQVPPVLAGVVEAAAAAPPRLYTWSAGSDADFSPRTPATASGQRRSLLSRSQPLFSRFSLTSRQRRLPHPSKRAKTVTHRRLFSLSLSLVSRSRATLALARESRTPGEEGRASPGSPLCIKTRGREKYIPRTRHDWSAATTASSSSPPVMRGRESGKRSAALTLPHVSRGR